MSSRARYLTFKLVFLRDGRVGKTSLLTKHLVIGGVPITLSIWDTAGQERFHALGPIYYRDADGMYLINTTVLLVYDVTDTDTFLRVRKWVKELQQMASNDIVMVIAANKSDLIRSKKYDIQEAESYAMTIGAKLFLTSAKFGSGINDVFLDITARLLQKKKNSAQGSLPAQPRKGIIVVDDASEREPPPKCWS
ncbi:unnamed protein product [Musa hybrid cultivar]